MTLYQRLSLVVPLVLPLAFSGFAEAADVIALQAGQIKALGIESTQVGQADSSRTGSLPARILVPNEQMRIVAAPVGGLVEMLAVAPGSIVKKGQVVARLASPQALELQRDALQASSQSNLLQQALKRDELLFAEGLIAESRLQSTRAAASQATAQASERRQGLLLAGVTPGKLGGFLPLTAAIDGVVLEQGVQLGQRVEASTLIYRIAQLAPLWLEIQAPVDFAAGLQVGLTVNIAQSKVSGKLISLGRAVDSASQTVLLRALVNEGAADLRPGQVIEVEIAGGNAHGPGQHLPASAVIRNEGQALVFVEIANDEQGIRYAVRPVKVISQSGDRITVDGVKAGEKLASKGLSSLKGMLTGVGKE